MRASCPFGKTRIELLRDPENAILYFEEAFAAGDMAGFKLALRNVADARLGGTTPLSERAELNRGALYRSLSEVATPRSRR